MDTIAETPAQYPINKANASTLAKKRWEVWRAEQIADKSKLEAADAILKNPEQSSLRAIVLEQMQDIDEELKDAKPVDKPRLVQAKTQLWALLFPKPRPSRKDRIEAPQA